MILLADIPQMTPELARILSLFRPSRKTFACSVPDRRIFVPNGYEAGGGVLAKVTLGDYDDRAPDSREVIERLCSSSFPSNVVVLKGNHEDIFLRFIEDPAMAEQIAQRVFSE